MALVFFAVLEEARPFVREWERATGDRARKTVPQGAAWAPRFDFPELRVQVTGMGPANARRLAEAALTGERPDFVVTSGLAGGLDPALRTGDLVFDADDGFPRTEALRRAARAGRFVQVERVAATVAAKAQLRRETGADAVDMESAAIRELCRARGIPAATLRVISDPADEDVPLDFGELVTADGRLDQGKLALALLRSPGKIAAVVRLWKSVERTSARLAEALVDVLETPRRPEARR